MLLLFMIFGLIWAIVGLKILGIVVVFWMLHLLEDYNKKIKNIVKMPIESSMNRSIPSTFLSAISHLFSHKVTEGLGIFKDIGDWKFHRILIFMDLSVENRQ